MASRTLRRIGTLGAGRVLLAFTIKPNGTSTPTIVEDGGSVVSSISRSGVGVYVVTLKDTWLELVSASVTVQLGTAANTMVQVTGAPTLSTTKQITFTILTAGVAADIAAGTNNKLLVTLVVRDSGLG